jgi:hypothetical protein
MSDFRNDPNFVRNGMNDVDSRVQWAAVAVILLLVGGLIVASAWTGGDSQTAQVDRWVQRRRCRRVSCGPSHSSMA